MLDTTTTPVTVRSQGLPDEMRLLLDAYPRDSWAAHPGFREKTRQWLGAHRMFRQMAEWIRRDAEGYLDSELAPEDYAGRLSCHRARGRENALDTNGLGSDRWRGAAQIRADSVVPARLNRPKVRIGPDSGSPRRGGEGGLPSTLQRAQRSGNEQLNVRSRTIRRI